MTNQETIAALAAELTRLRKNPDYGDCASPEGLCPISDKLILAALSGVAAEVIADDGFYIVKSGSQFLDCDEDGNEIWIRWVWEVICHDWQCGNTMIRQHETYHEALIAALRQIETEKKQ